jgi:hypothetical protein
MLFGLWNMKFWESKPTSYKTSASNLDIATGTSSWCHKQLDTAQNRRKVENWVKYTKQPCLFVGQRVVSNCGLREQGNKVSIRFLWFSAWILFEQKHNPTWGNWAHGVKKVDQSLGRLRHCNLQRKSSGGYGSMHRESSRNLHNRDLLRISGWISNYVCIRKDLTKLNKEQVEQGV